MESSPLWSGSWCMEVWEYICPQELMMSLEDIIFTCILLGIVSVLELQWSCSWVFCKIIRIYKFMIIKFIIRFEKKNFLLPWIGLTIINPCVLLLSVLMDLFFFNLSGAVGSLMREGFQAAITLYLIYSVYCLYLEMGVHYLQHQQEETGDFE